MWLKTAKLKIYHYENFYSRMRQLEAKSKILPRTIKKSLKTKLKIRKIKLGRRE